jgi:hypothetical protein
MRYFADDVLTLKAISAALVAVDPQFKIDGGELTRGGEMLGEIEINLAGSDLFGEEVQAKVSELERVPNPSARQVIARLRNIRSVVALSVLYNQGQEGDGARVMERLSPLWPVLGKLSTGLAQADGEGFYDGGQLVVPLQ